MQNEQNGALAGLIEALQQTMNEKTRIENEYMRLLADERQMQEQLKRIRTARIMSAGALEMSSTLASRLQSEIERRRAFERQAAGGEKESGA